MHKTNLRILCWVSLLAIMLGMCAPIIVHNKMKDMAPQELATQPTDATEGVLPDKGPVSLEPTAQPTAPSINPTEQATHPTQPEPTSSTTPVNLTEDEVYLLATAIYLEGGIETELCQTYIGSVILNRMEVEGKTLYEVLYAPGQFSVADMLASSDPTQEQLDIANYLLENGSVLPECVLFFRAERYHDWNTVKTDLIQPYVWEDRTYFSHDVRLCNDHH